jgi:hypothetical protein
LSIALSAWDGLTSGYVIDEISASPAQAALSAKASRS